jgi:hypothetical protein
MTTIYKAQPIGDQVIPDLDIRATDTLPEQPFFPSSTWEKHWRDIYAAQAGAIADALYASLPGGTLDALLVEMLDRKRSILKVKA